jgi:hypothetical protein
MLFRAPGHEKLDLSFFKHALGASCVALGLVACGSSDGLPNVTVSISSDTTRAAVRNSVSLTWSSTNATAFSASGGWSGAKAASGTEDVVLNSEEDLIEQHAEHPSFHQWKLAKYRDARQPLIRCCRPGVHRKLRAQRNLVVRPS